MLDDLLPFKTQLIAFGLALPRMMVIFLVLPIFNSNLIPGLMRSGIAAALTFPAAMYLAPSVQSMGLDDLQDVRLLAVLLKESFIGLVLGYMLSIPFSVLEGVGFLIDNQRGASIAATINPLTGHDTSPLGVLFNQAFIVFFLVSGGFILFLDVVYSSYEVFPVLSMLPAFGPGFPSAALSLLDGLVRMSLLLAAPVMIAMFLSELGLGLVSRFAPQLQVFFLAMPVKSALAMLMLALYGTTLFDYAMDRIRAMRETVPQAREMMVR